MHFRYEDQKLELQLAEFGSIFPYNLSKPKILLNDATYQNFAFNLAQWQSKFLGAFSKSDTDFIRASVPIMLMRGARVPEYGSSLAILGRRWQFPCAKFSTFQLAVFFCIG